MKLTKDQTQKIFLGAMLLIGVIYGFITFLINPVQFESALNKQKMEALEPKILAAKAQIAKTKALEAKLPEAAKLTNQVNAMIPEGSPVAWFPPRISEYFKRQGVEKATARQNGPHVEKELPGYQRLNWGVDLPRVEFGQLAAAMAEMENGEPLLEIQSLDIESNRDEVQVQRANLIVNTLVRQ
jgi:hypothetical protein